MDNAGIIHECCNIYGGPVVPWTKPGSSWVCNIYGGPVVPWTKPGSSMGVVIYMVVQ